MSGEWRERSRTQARQFFQRRPLVVAAMAALFAVVAVDFGSERHMAVALSALLACLAAIVVPWRLAGRRVGVLALIGAIGAGGLHGMHLVRQERLAGQIRVEREGQESIRLRGEVRRLSYARDGRWGGLVRLTDGRGSVWWNGSGAAPAIGQIVTARGSWLEERPPRNPGEFPLQQWLWRMGVSGQFRALEQSQHLEPLEKIREKAEAFRQWVRAATATGLDPEKPETKVIRAIVLGEIADDSDVLIHAYRNSGTLHVFSVSGLHVSMVAILVWWFARLLRVPRRWAACVVIVVVFGYAWVSGWSPPAARSAWMASLVVAAFLVKRPADVGNLLGAVLLGSLLVDGHSIFQAGVQLSYGVVGVLLCAAPPVANALFRLWQPDPFLPRPLWARSTEWRVKGWRWLSGSLGASVVATVGSAPLMIWHFRLLTPIAILAGVPVGIMVFLMLAISFLVVAISPVSPQMAAGLNQVNAGLATGCTATAGWFARLPGGNFPIPPREVRRPCLVIYDLPYGGGASCWVDEGQATLCDCGSEQSFTRSVLPSLRMFGAEPRRLVLTHPDAGHIGGAMLGMETLPLREVWWPVAKARSKVYQEMQRQGVERKLSGGLFVPGQSWRVGKDTTLTVLAVPHAGDANVRADDRVAIMLWESRGWRILQTSDAGLATERMLMDSGLNLRADVLIMGRHTADLTGSEEFLSAVSPRIIVAGHSEQTRSTRVPDSLERWCERQNVLLFHQGRCGAVTIRPQNGALEAEGFVNHQSVRLER